MFRELITKAWNNEKNRSLHMVCQEVADEYVKKTLWTDDYTAFVIITKKPKTLYNQLFLKSKAYNQFRILENYHCIIIWSCTEYKWTREKA